MDLKEFNHKSFWFALFMITVTVVDFILLNSPYHGRRSSTDGDIFIMIVVVFLISFATFLFTTTIRIYRWLRS